MIFLLPYSPQNPQFSIVIDGTLAAIAMGNDPILLVLPSAEDILNQQKTLNTLDLYELNELLIISSTPIRPLPPYPWIKVCNPEQIPKLIQQYSPTVLL